jgi:hypothetical protein
MLLHGTLQIFITGFFGGCIGELLTLYNLRAAESGVPPHLKKTFYWVMSVVMAVVGGVVAVLYGFKEIQAIPVVQIGASCPVLLKSFIATVAPPAKPSID